MSGRAKKPKTIRRALVVPVHNLVLGPEINNELQLDSVVFVSRSMLRRSPRYRALRSVTEPVPPGLFTAPEMPAIQAFAIAPLTGKARAEDARRRIRDSFWLLVSSQFGRGTRGIEERFGSPPSPDPVWDQEFLFSGAGSDRVTSCRQSPMMPYSLGREWPCLGDRHFFINLMSIISGRRPVKSTWITQLKRAARLAGRSWFSDDLPTAFLYNWQALECLLLGPDNRKSADEVTDRLVGRFGWTTREDRTPWKDHIDWLYGLRNKYVHRAEAKDISLEAVAASDNLVKNVLSNVCRLSRQIRHHEDLVKLSEALKARQQLGMPRPREPYLTYSTGMADPPSCERWARKREQHWLR